MVEATTSHLQKGLEIWNGSLPSARVLWSPFSRIGQSIFLRGIPLRIAVPIFEAMYLAPRNHMNRSQNLFRGSMSGQARRTKF